MIIQDFVQDFTQDLKLFSSKILESSCQKIINNFAKSYQDIAGIYIQDLSIIFIKS